MNCSTKSARGWLGLGVVLTAVASCTMLIGGAPAEFSSAIDWNTGNNPHSVQTVALAEIDTKSKRHADSLSQAFRDASAAVMPSVVTIRSLPGDVAATRGDDFGDQQLPDELKNHPFFRRFFGDLPQGNLRSPQPRGKAGAGSGVIVDSAGIVLTNNHVVDGAGKVVVKLQDGREFEATDWRTDPKTDIAIVRIEAPTSLPAAKIGNSDDMLVGDWVLAVGAPFGLNETVTTGIVSAKARGIGITDREEFIQTDAAINPGNSGGPLVNLDGEVIGINTAISTTSGGYQGIGFAVPINLARWVGDELATNGTVRRAYLGVGIQQVTNTLSHSFGLESVKGAVVTDVREGTPAAKAGLKTGDVIVEFDGRSIKQPRDLQGIVERADLNESHDLVVIREGEEITLRVNVAEMPGKVAASSEPAIPSDDANARFGDLGVAVTDLTSDVAQQLNVAGIAGVVITEVKPDSPAAQAGLQESMVIQRVGNVKVSNVEDFRAAMKDAAVEDGVLMLVNAGGNSRFVVVK